MRIARASERDIDMAIDLTTALEHLRQGYMPAKGEDEDPGPFDIDDAAHCHHAMNEILHIVEGGSLGRVVWGMAFLLDPSSRILDAESDVLELAPDLRAARSAAER